MGCRIVLGRDAPCDKLGHWLLVAAPVPGWTGFAIGRSIWQDALHAHLGRYRTAREARRPYQLRLPGLRQLLSQGRDGMLTGQAGPEGW